MGHGVGGPGAAPRHIPGGGSDQGMQVWCVGEEEREVRERGRGGGGGGGGRERERERERGSM